MTKMIISDVKTAIAFLENHVVFCKREDYDEDTVESTKLFYTEFLQGQFDEDFSEEDISKPYEYTERFWSKCIDISANSTGVTVLVRTFQADEWEFRVKGDSLDELLVKVANMVQDKYGKELIYKDKYVFQ